MTGAKHRDSGKIERLSQGVCGQNDSRAQQREKKIQIPGVGGKIQVSVDSDFSADFSVQVVIR
ncbi:MAG: hypothetical protein C4563_02245 [Desulfobulbus sp.]|nr:MAG: hypothetical protein C4563_02245 [Desulfobulbus sp.]